MPLIWCQCQSCLTSGPHGRSFSKVDFKTHQLRLQREQQDSPLSSQASAENELFARSVADSASAPPNAPSAMWNSREHIQAQTLDESPLRDSPNPATTASIIAESLRRLTLSSRIESPSPHATDDLATTFHRLDISDIQETHIAPPHAETSIIHEADDFAEGSHPSPITSPQSEPSSSQTADTFDLSNITDPPPSPVDAPGPNRHLHDPRNKQENNVHTTRALKILNGIEQLMQESAGKLCGSPTKSVRDDVANTLSQSRQKVAKVTRSTPRINALKEMVAQHILHVENRLIELDTLFPPSPEDGSGPVEHSNGESLFTPPNPTTDETTQNIILPRRFKNSIPSPKLPSFSEYSAASL
jgi:hypothetical protein